MNQFLPLIPSGLALAGFLIYEIVKRRRSPSGIKRNVLAKTKAEEQSPPADCKDLAPQRAKHLRNDFLRDILVYSLVATFFFGGIYVAIWHSREGVEHPRNAANRSVLRSGCLLRLEEIGEVAALGPHTDFADGENKEILTINAGWMDTAHIRDLMDMTARVYGELVKGGNKKGSVLSLPGAAMFTFTLTKDVPRPEFVSVAASIAYDWGLAYEIVTSHPRNKADKGYLKFGAYESAYSPEDLPSNALGVHLAAKYINKIHETASEENVDALIMDFNAKMGTALVDALKALGDVDRDTAERVYKAYVEGNWIRNGLLKKPEAIDKFELLKRNSEARPLLLPITDDNGKVTTGTADPRVKAPESRREYYSVSIHAEYQGISWQEVDLSKSFEQYQLLFTRDILIRSFPVFAR